MEKRYSAHVSECYVTLDSTLKIPLGSVFLKGWVSVLMGLTRRVFSMQSIDMSDSLDLKKKQNKLWELQVMDKFLFWTRIASEGVDTTLCCCFPTFALYEWGEHKHCLVCPMQKPQTWWNQGISLLLRGLYGSRELWGTTAQPCSKRTRSKSCFLGELIFLARERKRRSEVRSQSRSMAGTETENSSLSFPAGALLTTRCLQL